MARPATTLPHPLVAGATCVDLSVLVPVYNEQETLPALERRREGHEVVYAVRRKRKEGLLKRVAYAAFYRLLQRIAYLKIPLDSGDFSLLDHRVVAVLKEMPERNKFLRGLRTWAGFRQTDRKSTRLNSSHD